MRPAHPTRYRFVAFFVVLVVVVLVGVWFAVGADSDNRWSLKRMLALSGVLREDEVEYSHDVRVLTDSSPKRAEGVAVRLPGRLVGDPRDSDHPWHELMAPVRHQKQCNACWAFAIAGMMQDRKSLYENSLQPELSPQSLLDYVDSPDGRISGCRDMDKCQCGEIPGYAMMMAREFGLTTVDCQEYRAGNANMLLGHNHAMCDSPNCFYPEKYRSECDRRYRFKTVFAIESEKDALEELRNNGTLMAVIGILSGFAPKADKVFDTSKDSYKGYHAVCVVGAGEHQGVPYWLIRNSWGDKWCDEGYFMLRRGSNALGIGKVFPFFGGYF